MSTLAEATGAAVGFGTGLYSTRLIHDRFDSQSKHVLGQPSAIWSATTFSLAGIATYMLMRHPNYFGDSGFAFMALGTYTVGATVGGVSTAILNATGK